MPRINFCIVLLFFIWGSFLFAEANPRLRHAGDSFPRRWAVLASSPLNELVTSELSRSAEIELVERAELERIMRERAISVESIVSKMSERRTLGTVLGADRRDSRSVIATRELQDRPRPVSRLPAHVSLPVHERLDRGSSR